MREYTVNAYQDMRTGKVSFGFGTARWLCVLTGRDIERRWPDTRVAYRINVRVWPSREEKEAAR